MQSIFGGSFAKLLVVGLVATSASAAQPSGLDRPVDDLQAVLGRLTGCADWRSIGDIRDCNILQTDGVVNLHRDPADDTVDTIELSPVIVAHPPRRSVDIKRSRKIAIDVVRAVLPGWKQAPTWLAHAMDDARHWHARHVIKIGPVTVLVQHLQPADLNDTFAEIVVTKRSSIEQWTYNNW